MPRRESETRRLAGPSLVRIALLHGLDGSLVEFGYTQCPAGFDRSPEAACRRLFDMQPVGFPESPGKEA